MRKSKKSKKDQLVLGDELLGTRLGEIRDRSPKKSGTDLFIIDNSDEDWKVRDYLHDWCQTGRDGCTPHVPDSTSQATIYSR